MTVTVEQPRTDTADEPRAADKKIDRLNTASLRRVIEPDTDVKGGVGEGQVIPSEMLTVADLDLHLTAPQRATLSREELASVAISGVRFETFLMSGFAAQMACSSDLTDARIVYMLHEMGEETRHSRLFIRLVDQLQPKAVDPLQTRIGQLFFRRVLRTVLNRPAVFCVLVLAGEEIPDLFQKKIADHPETDPFVRDVNHYHRMEEARHLAFARAVLPELWSESSFIDRALIRYEIPRLIRLMFNGMIHPGVYRTIGLPALQTWLDAARSPSRVALRHEATRPVLAALVDGGCFRSGSIPARWRRLCGVDRAGEYQSGAERLASPIMPIVKAVLRWESTSVGKAKTVLEGVASAALPGSGGKTARPAGDLLGMIGGYLQPSWGCLKKFWGQGRDFALGH